MTILMYHSITSERPANRFEVTVDQFRQQMLWLQRAGRRGLSLAAARESNTYGASRPVVLTFDDGYADNYTNALPVLRECGFSATIFVATGHVGGANEWETKAFAVKPLLTWDQMAEMARAGIEFGSHTVSHLDLRSAAVAVIRQELLQSRRDLAERLGTEAAAFAYPYGYARDDMAGLLGEAGYRHGLLAGTYGANTLRTDPYALHRAPVWSGDSVGQFAAKVRGWCRWRYYADRVSQVTRWALGQVMGSSRRGH